MNGTLLDLMAIMTGAFLGIFAKAKVLSEDIQGKAMQALAVCTFLVGIAGVEDISNPIICILSIVTGALIGNILAIEDRLVWGINKIVGSVSRSAVSERFVEGFISFTLVSITGSMAIVGPISNTLNGDITILMTKSVLDFVTAVLFGATFGLPIVFSVIVVFLYQGMFSALAYVLIPILTTEVINDMSCIGSLLIFIVGFNILKVTEIKTMNLTPAIFLPVILHMIIR